MKSTMFALRAIFRVKNGCSSSGKLSGYSGTKSVSRYLLNRRNMSSESNNNGNGKSGTIHTAFGKYLLLTNTLSSGILMVLGDLVQQEIEFQRNMLEKRYDYHRMFRMLVVGLVLGVEHHYYYTYLSVLLPKRDLPTVTIKILLDQFVMSPICIVSFFYTVCTLEQKSITQSGAELKHKFIEVYTMDWCFWPPAQFVNFYFVPDKYQVIVINAATMVYNVFLSYIKHREVAEKCGRIISEEIKKHN